MTTIPASAIVQVTPSVLSAGGRALDIIAVMLTDSDRIPIDVIQDFGNQTDVSDYFGPTSDEAALGAIYFNGFDNSNIKPSSLRMVQYPQTDVPAWLRGGEITLTLAEMQNLTPAPIGLMINGATVTAPSVDLGAATSFSDAASIIEESFTATQATASACTISGTTLTVGGTVTGEWAQGQTVVGASVAAGTYIVEQLGGTQGGAGTYTISASQTVGSPEAMTGGVIPQVTFDSVSGGFKFATVNSGDGQTIDFAGTNSLTTALNLTESEGAVISQGAGAAVPAAFMTALTERSQNWATFMTTFDPDGGSGNDVKLAFAQWTDDQLNRYCYVCWDTDQSPAETVPAAASLGHAIQAANMAGTHLIGGDGTNGVTASYAAFVCGAAASIDFTEHNGRITFAFRSQTGLLPTCSNESNGDNLISNGYNFYGAYGTANDSFIFLYPGSVSGPFQWMDSFIDQIWLNNGFQLALMELLVNAKSIPYNAQGYALIEAACLDMVNAGLNFGAFRAGVTLSMSQAAQVNGDAGIKIDHTLNQRGWYLQVRDASPQVRQARGSPPCTFWYMDGQSVQKINLASIELM